MFDLNAIVNAALQQAVAEAIKPLVERIAALENNPAIGTDTVLEQRIAALAERLDNITEASEKRIRVIAEAAAEQALDNHCETYNHDDYDNVVSNWNDEEPTGFVRESDIDDKIKETVEEVLNDASFSISI